MELSELKFVVNTKQLEDAATKIKELAVEVSKLNKPVTDAALKSEKLAQAQAKTARETAKLEEANTKTAIAAERLTKAQKANTTAANAGNTIAERQTEILKFQTEGYSKGQAATLAAAKAAGAYDDVLQQLGVTLKDQRILMGGQPFDNSIGLMQKLENETRISTEVNNLFNKSLGLTEKQMIDLAREHERLIKKYELEGKSLSGVAAEYDELIRKSVMLTQTNDARTNSMKAQIKAQNDTAKANEYIAKELERVNRLTESNGDITSATNNRLIRFEKELKASGITAAEVTTRLDAYRTSLLATQKAAGNRQIDYLSRALGPQITDIFVGLATGQAPLTILLQQGGQLRDQFALAGVAGSEMGKMLVQASKAMVSSVKDIGLAVGQLITGAFVGAGKAVTDFGLQITGTGFLLESMRSGIVKMVGENSMVVKTFDAAGKAITLFTGIAVVAGITALASLAIAMSNVIKEENALNRALNLTGAAMGLTLDMAYDAARGMEQFGVSTGTALTVLTAMSKAGGMSADSLKMIATTAKAMKTAFDIPIEETVKQFKTLQEKPTESLTKLAIQLGTIPVEILKQVDAYERAGKVIKAAELATKAYADAGKDAANRTVENFGTITRLGIQLSKIWDKAWESIMNIGRKGTLSEQISNAENELKSRIKAAAALSGSPYNRGLVDADTKALEATLESLKEQDRLLKSQAASRATNSAEASKFEDDKKKRDEAANKLKADAKKLEESYNSELDKAKETYLAQIGALDHLTKSEITLQKIKASTNWNAYTQQQRDYITSLYEATIVSEKAVKSEKERADAIEKLMQVQKKADDALFDSLDAEHALNMQVLEQTQLLELQASLIKATDEERKKALTVKKLDLALEKEIADIKKRAIPEAEQNDQINRARQRRTDAEKNLNTELAIDAATKTLEEYNKIKDGVTDSIVTALIDGGEEGGKKLRAIIEAELRKPVVMIVKAVVDAALGGITGSAGGAGSSIAGNIIGNTVGSIAIGGSTLGAMGQYFATGFMNTIAGTGAATGAAAGGAIGGANGLAMSAGAYGPYALAAVAVLNALGAFRTTKQVGGGISGTLGGSVDQYGTMRKSGTLFNGPSYFRQNQGTFAGNDLLQTSFQQLKDSTKAMADTLKLSSTGVEDFTKTIDISFDGLTNTQIEEKIASTLKSVNDELAALVLGAGATADQLNTLYNNVMQQRYDLETQLLELQGKTVELRERERAKIYDVNKEMFDQIKALEDQKVANEQAAAAMEKLTSVTTTIVDEINRLRGVSTSSSGLEAQFAILTAQARSGDLAALAQLPEVTKGLEQIAASSAVNATDIIVARARLAQSLQDTLGYFPSGTSLSTSSTSVSASNALSSGLTVSSGTSVNSASSNQELLAALVTEVQGLRAEVRADVSHNAKTAKILERVNQDGESLSITTLV